MVEPANTASNLAYLLVGVGLVWLAHGSRSRHLRLFGPAAVVVGLCSGIYHASYTFVLQILDFAGMYVFTYLLLTLNARRLGWLQPERWFRRFVQLVVVTTLLTVALDFLEVPIQSIVGLQIGGVVVSELWIWRGDPPPSSRAWWAGLGLLAAASLFSLLDVTRTWCDPMHPFLQGHAIWHVLSALALFVLFFHYRQFEGQLEEEGASFNSTMIS